MKIDEIDEKILSILKKNSRTSNVEISKIIELTEGAVRHRIDRLLSDGVIERFTIDSKEKYQIAVVMVKAKAGTKLMMKEIKGLRISKDSYEVSGDYDGCLIIEGENLKDVDSKIDKIRKLKSVADTKTFIAMKKW